MQYVKHFSIWEVKAKLLMLSGTQSLSQELYLQAWSLVRTVSRHCLVGAPNLAYGWTESGE